MKPVRGCWNRGLSLDILQKSTDLSEEEIQKTQSKLQSGFVNKIV